MPDPHDTKQRPRSGDADRPPGAPPAAAPLALQKGQRWGDSARYVIDRPLGSGGNGEVYAATDTLLGRPIALKVLSRAPDVDENASRRRILREARFAARVEHERVARV